MLRMFMMDGYPTLVKIDNGWKIHRLPHEGRYTN